MLSFAYPEYLYLLLLIPVIVALYIYARFSRLKNLKRFGRTNVLSALMPDVSKYKPGIKLVLQLIALVMIVIMLARPRAGAVEQTMKVRGIEVMVALDVSNSMNASSNEDPKSVSRLQRAKLLLERLIDNFGDDKVGLIVFAGNAYTQLPITADFTSAKMFINSISTDMVSSQGTAIGSAIKLAMNSFSSNDKIQKTIIVITDGENFEDDAVMAAKNASRMSEELNKLAKSDLQKVVYSQNSEQFPIFAWIALVFLIGDMFVLERKNSWLKKINFFTKEDKQRHGK